MDEDRDKVERIVSTAKKILYLVIYVVVFLFFAPSVLWVLYCFERLLYRADDEVITWAKVFFVVAGSVVICIQLGVMFLLKKFVSIRAVGVPLGGLAFWSCWALPILSLALAVACSAAAIGGFEFELSGGSDWDWD